MYSREFHQHIEVGIDTYAHDGDDRHVLACRKWRAPLRSTIARHAARSEGERDMTTISSPTPQLFYVLAEARQHKQLLHRRSMHAMS